MGLGHQRCVADRIRREAPNLHIALVFDLHPPLLVRHHHPLAVVGVHGVGGQTNAVGGQSSAFAVCLRHHVRTHHAAGFAHVQLGRESPVVLVFIFWVAVGAHLLANVGGYAGVVSQKVQQTFGIVLVLRHNLGARLVVCTGILIVHADHIRRKRAAVVDVRFLVGHWLEVHQVPIYVTHFFGIYVAQQQLKLGRVVGHGARNRNLVGGIGGQTQPKIISLRLGIASAACRQSFIADAPKQTAGGIARGFVGVNAIGKLVFIEHLHAVVGFGILVVGLAPHGVAHPRLGH